MQYLGKREYKPDDWIVFTKDIRSGYEGNRKVLIPKNNPCKLVKLNDAHIWVEWKNRTVHLRFIPKRMKKAGPLAKALYA